MELVFDTAFLEPEHGLDYPAWGVEVPPGVAGNRDRAEGATEGRQNDQARPTPVGPGAGLL